MLTSSRRGAGPLDPGLEDLGAALPRPQHHPGVDGRVGVQLDLDGGHDAVVPAAAAQRPEQVGVVVVGGADERAVGGHELDRADAVGGEAVLAGEPREAAAEHVADDADVGARAGQRGEAELGGGLGDLGPQRAGLAAGDPRLGVDLDAAQLVGLDEDRVGERVVGAGVVAGALGGHEQAALTGELDDGDDVGGRRRDGYGGGALVDGEVPGLAGLVPIGVAGGADAALHALAELGGVNAGGIGDEHAAMLRRGGFERIGDIPSVASRSARSPPAPRAWGRGRCTSGSRAPSPRGAGRRSGR